MALPVRPRSPNRRHAECFSSRSGLSGRNRRLCPLLISAAAAIGSGTRLRRKAASTQSLSRFSRTGMVVTAALARTPVSSEGHRTCPVLLPKETSRRRVASRAARVPGADTVRAGGEVCSLAYVVRCKDIKNDSAGSLVDRRQLAMADTVGTGAFELEMV